MKTGYFHDILRSKVVFREIKAASCPSSEGEILNIEQLCKRSTH